MTFAGLSNDKQRADVIAYLDSLSPNPVPLPKPQNADGAAPPAAGAPANAGSARPPAQSGGAKGGANPGNH